MAFCSLGLSSKANLQICRLGLLRTSSYKKPSSSSLLRPLDKGFLVAKLYQRSIATSKKSCRDIKNVRKKQHQTSEASPDGNASNVIRKGIFATPGISHRPGPLGGNDTARAIYSLSRVINPKLFIGTKGKPAYVVIQESKASLIFRWFRFLASCVVSTWLFFSAVTTLIEVASSFRRPQTARRHLPVKDEKRVACFDDVHGCPEAKVELQEVVEFLRHPEKFKLGAKLPKGVLLVGPPGTGKTLLARAVAGEAGVPFFYVSGSEFDEAVVGVGAKRVRDLFTSARSKSPAIIFIDEIDAIGGRRSLQDPAHAKQTLNQLLTVLDGFVQDGRVVIIGATNTPDMLDKALIRPGRFDRHVNVDLPDIRGRIDILRHHAKKIKLSPDVDLEAIAARSPGRSGAELENMLNVAALKASRARATAVSWQDLEWAFDRVTRGSEKKSMMISRKEIEMTAYHEAGHALVQLFDKESTAKLYKVTIVPKGTTLGHTDIVPQMDGHSLTSAGYMANIRVALGGKAAEELQYGKDTVTSRVSSDLESATDMCFTMVTKLGMSAELGPMEYGMRYKDVKQLLTDKRKELDFLAKALMKYETLDLAEVQKVLRGEDLTGRPTVSQPENTRPLRVIPAGSSSDGPKS